jgi:hypothetical protein
MFFQRRRVTHQAANNSIQGIASKLAPLDFKRYVLRA